MARYTQADRDNVRKSYIFDKVSLMTVSALHDVPYQTCCRWKQKAKDAGDDWDKVRTAHTVAGGELEDVARQILTDFVVQFKATMDIIKNNSELKAFERVSMLTSLSDSYNKTMGASRKLMPETSKLATALEVLERQAEYIKTNKPELLTEFLAILEPFGELLERELK